jgi:hypothetical protein
MRIRVLIVAAILVASIPFALAVSGAAKAPAPQASNTNCTRLYGHLGTAVKEPKGALGYPVFITNISRTSCTIQGVPTATYNPSSGRAATRVYAKSRGARVTLSANGAVDVVITVSPTTKWAATRCGPLKSHSAKLSFGPRKLGVTVATSFALCSKLASTTISGVATLSVPLS